MGSYYGIGTMKSFFNREGGYLYLIDNESEKDGAPGGNRTHDPLLRRQLYLSSIKSENNENVAKM